MKQEGQRVHPNKFRRRGRCPHRPAGYDTRAVGKDVHARTAGFRADEGHRPLRKNGPFPHRRGRCPHRPAGYDTRTVRKDVHACPIGFRADVGIGPYEKTVRFLTVGGDAHIAPLGTATEWSEKTYTPVPPASGPMWASAPTEKRFVSPL